MHNKLRTYPKKVTWVQRPKSQIILNGKGCWLNNSKQYFEIIKSIRLSCQWPLTLNFFILFSDMSLIIPLKIKSRPKSVKFILFLFWMIALLSWQVGGRALQKLLFQIFLSRTWDTINFDFYIERAHLIGIIYII